ncbi:MAG: hypothetical protein QXW47_06960 [Candidatus Jordarchaeales archaeon]|nr:hypothetical protein [Candidatus Jordarchaeia archaeon]
MKLKGIDESDKCREIRGETYLLKVEGNARFMALWDQLVNNELRLFR